MPVDVSRLLLVAHGSRDPRAADVTRALVRAVRLRTQRPVEAAFLDFSTPRLADAVASAGSAVVVPLLLTAAYHGRVDVPGEVARARAATSGVQVRLAEVLGPVGGPVFDRAALDSLVAALVRRLDEAGPGRPDAVVLAAAGSRDPSALDTVDLVARALSVTLGVPCRAGYASGAGPGVDGVVAGLAAEGARRIATATYFLAPGLLYDRAVGQARAAGAMVTAAALGDAREVVDLVLARACADPSAPGPEADRAAALAHVA
jgi:sirohydrochlorin ferrochelatase